VTLLSTISIHRR